MEKVKATKKGLFVRIDNEFGALVFSPFSGLFFAVAKDYVCELLNYCNEKDHNLPTEIIDCLEIGFSNQKNFEIKSHWLPNKDSFSYISDETFPKAPVVVNWLISNKCSFNCSYCYACDVVDKVVEQADATKVAKNILQTNPLAVVLSGGEPLMDKNNLIEGIKVLGNKTGIIVDSNGYEYDDNLALLFKKYHVVVRISFDTFHGIQNSKARPLKSTTDNQKVLNTIIANISKYRAKKIPVLIHTVVTPVNKNCLEDMYRKLPLLKVNGWRLFEVVKPNDKNKEDQYKKLMTYGKSNSVDESQKEILKELRMFRKKIKSSSDFSVQIIQSPSGRSNSVVLVLPSGKFVTESRLRNEKTEISVASIFSKVDLIDHYERYLGGILL